MKYFLCCANSVEELTKKVNQKLNEGYIPCGGVSSTISRKADTYSPTYYKYKELPDYVSQLCQALIKN